MILASATPAPRVSPLSMTARARERVYRPGDLVVVDMLVVRSPSSSDDDGTSTSEPLPLEVAVRTAVKQFSEAGGPTPRPKVGSFRLHNPRAS